MDNENIQRMKAGVSGTFSRAAETYDQVGPRFFAPLGQRLVEVAEIPVGATVLDVAAGRGAVLFPAAERVGAQGHVIGIDLAEGMVKETNAEIQRRAIANAEMRVMDAEVLDFRDETFDVVLCGFGIHIFSQRAKALAEFRRVLKSGGKLAVSTWGRDDERWKWMRELQKKYRPTNASTSSSAPNPLNNPVGLEEIMREAQFEQIRVVGEDPEAIYADEETWWATQWSHFGRFLLETLSPEMLDNYKAEAFEKLQMN